MEYSELMALADLLFSMLIIQHVRGSNYGGVPVDTGNLRDTIRIEANPNNDEIKIIIGGELANYVFETNEPWVHRRGKNPNEGWLDNTLSHFSTLQAERVKGVYKTNV